MCLFSILMYNLLSVNNAGNANSQNISNIQKIQNSETIQTTSSEETKISPNAIITFFKHYNGCGHTVKVTENVQYNEVNMSKADFSASYRDWTINKFTSSEIELSKNFDGNCGEHFFVKSSDSGYINIYNINDDGSLDLIEETAISIKYLSDTDIDELETGVALYGKNSLNSYIENFE